VSSGLAHGNQALDGQFWLDVAQESRAFLNHIMHPIMGLNPDYSELRGVAKSDVWGDSSMNDTFAMMHGALQ